MSINLPNLDDRTYADLVEEALAMIPPQAPGWTNFNPTDPGVTLVEMFAYLTEILLYRLNQVTDAHRVAFLRLLKGDPEWKPSEIGTNGLRDEMHQEIQRLRTPLRAVTCEDFERLARQSSAQVARARCIARHNLDLEDALDPGRERSDEISVVVVPNSTEPRPAPNQELIQTVRTYLEERSLLSTSVHVVPPRYQQIEIRVRLVCARDAQLEIVRSEAKKALQAHFDPLIGGPDGKGWPFGKSIYVSEIYKKLVALPMVDHVTKIRGSDAGKSIDEITINHSNKTQVRRTTQGDVIALDLEPWELVEIKTKPEWIEVERLANKQPAL